MKKYIILIAMLVVSVAGASAQERQDNNEGSRWNFGARAGVNFANDKDVNATSNVGFDLELLSDYHLQNKLYLRTGLGFRQYRLSWKPMYAYYSGEGSSCKNVSNTVYLPLRLAWKLPLSANLNLDLETGAFFSYVVGGKSKDGDGVKRSTFSSAFKDRYNFGGDCGAGVSFKQYYLGVSGTFNYRNITPGFVGAVKFGYTFK